MKKNLKISQYRVAYIQTLEVDHSHLRNIPISVYPSSGISIGEIAEIWENDDQPMDVGCMISDRPVLRS